MVRKFYRYRWLICGIALAGLIICPVRTSLIRVALIFLSFTLWIRLLILARKHAVVRNALIVVSIAAGLFFSFLVHNRGRYDVLQCHSCRIEDYDFLRSGPAWFGSGDDLAKLGMNAFDSD
jgi:hypothetical protein